MLTTDPTKTASARSITAVITHYGYARQDRKAGPREPITCIINDDMIDTAGTLCANVRELKALGAGDIYVCATHGIFFAETISAVYYEQSVSTLVGGDFAM